MTHRARRRRGTGLDNIALYADVPRRTKAKVDAAADAMGLSMAQALEVLVDLVDVDEQGRPRGWVADDQEELPLNRSA
jgi:hypothetical protein